MHVAGDVEAVSRNQRHVSQLSLLLPNFVFHRVPYNVGLIVNLVPATIHHVRNVKQERLLAFYSKIQTYKRFKRTILYYDTHTQSTYKRFKRTILYYDTHTHSQHTKGSKERFFIMTHTHSQHTKGSKERFFIMTHTHSLHNFWGNPVVNYIKLQNDTQATVTQFKTMKNQMRSSFFDRFEPFNCICVKINKRSFEPIMCLIKHVNYDFNPPPPPPPPTHTHNLAAARFPLTFPAPPPPPPTHTHTHTRSYPSSHSQQSASENVSSKKKTSGTASSTSERVRVAQRRQK